MNKKTGVFIPGRLNSERLPNKLILPFSDTNLFDIACKKLNNLPNRINKYALIYDKELIDIAKKYKNITIVIRDEETVNTDGPLSFIFKDLQDVEDTHLMFLNPCLAFITERTILKSIDKFNCSKNNYATSVKEFKNWLFDLNGKSLNDINYYRLTTKEIEPLYQAAHCFHIFNKNNFFQDNMMLKKDSLLLKIKEEETIDVDTYNDYKYAKWKYENENSN